jgi:hypothetical protein
MEVAFRDLELIGSMVMVQAELLTEFLEGSFNPVWHSVESVQQPSPAGANRHNIPERNQNVRMASKSHGGQFVCPCITTLPR